MKKYIYNLMAIAMNLQLFADAGTLVNATGICKQLQQCKNVIKNLFHDCFSFRHGGSEGEIALGIIFRDTLSPHGPNVREGPS